MAFNPDALLDIPAKPDKGSRLIPFAAVIGSLAVIVGLIIQNKDLFSDMLVQYAILLVLIVYLFIIIYVFFSDKILLKFSRIITKRKENKIARKYFPEFKYLKDKFDRSIKINNGITGVFDRLRSQSELYKYLNVPGLNEIDSLLINLDQSIKDFDKTGKDFELLIDQFEAIIKIYNNFYIKNVLKDIKCIKQLFNSDTIPKNIKDEYHDQKTEYDNFVNKYREFGEKVNREYGSKIVHDYIEKIEEV